MADVIVALPGFETKPEEGRKSAVPLKVSAVHCFLPMRPGYSYSGSPTPGCLALILAVLLNGRAPLHI